MTAPDPRLGEIEAKLRGAESYGYPSFMLATTDVAYLLAELRKAQDAFGRVEEVALKLDRCHAAGTPYAGDMIRAAVAAATGGERG